MQNEKKLKSPRYHILIFIIALKMVLLLIAVLIWGYKGLSILILFLSFITAIYSVRTKNTGYLLVTLGILFILLTQGNSTQLIKSINIILGLPNLVMMLYLVFSKKIKWRFRETFELAAKSVNNAENGFTPRPFPAGSKRYSQIEIEMFAKFLLKNLIAIPYFEKDRVVMVFSGNVYLRMLWLKNDFNEDTWIAFGYDGNISVNITQKTYLWYKDELTFDQLCSSFSDLFIAFFKLYKQGEGNKIISRMNSLKENVWTEL